MDEDVQGWLSSLTGFGSQRMEDVGILPFLAVMGISLLSSLLCSWLYVHFYRSRGTGSLVHRAFPLLGISITAIFICIQFSLPLSLGLLGALSIVRFRTPIKEPEEIGFIMLVIACSICCATFNLVFLSLILGFAFFALVVSRALGRLLERRLNEGLLVLSLPAAEWEEAKGELLAILDAEIPRGTLESVTETGEEAALSYGFPSLERASLLDVQTKLKGVHADLKLNVFFDQVAAT